MNSLIIALICTVFLYSTAQAFDCNIGDPCDLTGTRTPQKGYQCIQSDPTNVVCTCPGGLEINQPCRLCSRSNPLNNPCSNTTGRLLACLETDDYGLSYACLCSNGAGGTFLTSAANCNPTITLTPRPTTTTTTLPGGSTLCANGGVFFNGFCNCPSGYGGLACTTKYDTNLCDRVICKNNGTCAIRNTNGPYEGVCLCRYGTWGEYCELTGTLGFCSANPCLNGGACKENVIASTRHAYCHCPAGYNGPKCEKNYFPCPDVGKFQDPVMFTQGKYFECTNVRGTIRAEQKSCPRGLRFNTNDLLCTL